ncbi:MAG: hypothetical protein LC776_13040, partial [Acidobacteria bacterium]|nr:hypothetical protein [Acidobacteriota bacterium]
LASLVLVSALVCTLGGTSVFANALSEPNSETDGARTLTKSDTPARDEARPNEELRANMVQLVADAKAGKVAPAARPQIQPAKSNNLSKGKKIAIGVAIAVAVVAVIVIVAAKNTPGRVL